MNPIMRLEELQVRRFVIGENKMTPRKFNSEILITEEGKWIFRGNEITQDNVLLYFKENLLEDSKGIYILNRYGNFTEHGYVRVNGYPIKINGFHDSGGEIFAYTETGKGIFVNDMKFFSDRNEKLFCMLENSSYIKYSFGLDALTQLSHRLEEADGKYFLTFDSIIKDISVYTDRFDVPIPDDYKDILNI